MNNVYGTREIYSIRGDMCYDNKVMMNTAHSERTIPQAVILNVADHDENQTSNKRKTCLRQLRTRLRARNLLDLLIIIIVGTLMCLIEYGFIPNTKVGYVCQDPKISFQFRGDTITVTTLLVSAYFGPLFVIVLIEFLRENSFKRVCIGTVWYYYRECLIGGTFVLLITEIGKVLVGEPRPHFLLSCQPNVQCLPGEFVADYNCTTTMSRMFGTDLVRSFPSGHTSISCFVAFYCSYLIHFRVRSESVSALTKPFAIAVCLTYSLTCSLSRITDRRHHWWDVLAGAVLGACCFVYTISLLGQKREQKEIKLVRTNTSTTTLVDIKNKDATSVII